MEANTEHNKKDDIRFVLSGGGTKCAFHGAFLHRILHNPKFINKHYIDRIYGTSFGALIGFFVCLDRFDVIKDFFGNLNRDTLVPWFNCWGYGKYLKKIPLLGKMFGLIIDIIWLLISIKRKSLYSPIYGENILNSVSIDDKKSKKKLEKFYCCVYNVTQEKEQYVNGTHPLIKDYLLASSALWIVFPPRKIRQFKAECLCDELCNCKKDDMEEFCDCKNESHQYNEFIDGGVMKPIPMVLDNDFEGMYYVLTTKDVHSLASKDLQFNHTGKHLFEYLDKLISFLIDYHQHIEISHINKNWHEHHKINLINYKPKTRDPTNLEKEVIEQYIIDGMSVADELIKSFN